MNRKERATAIVKELRRVYPAAHCELDFRTPLQLLIATILSAQCTDRRVNIVTPALFKKYKTAVDFANAPQEEMEKEIQSTGFYRNKAKSVRGAAAGIVSKHGGEVPQTMDELIALPGVGRKTANVVLGNAFGKNEGIVVDTHVARLSRRLGLTKQATPEKIEAGPRQAHPPSAMDGFQPLAHLARSPPLPCPETRLRRLRDPGALPLRL